MNAKSKLLGWLWAILLCFTNALDLIASDKPNVVFVLSDNQSYYEMSCHGHADIKTPHIDKLAGQSVEFTNFHAPPFCSPCDSTQ